MLDGPGLDEDVNVFGVQITPDYGVALRMDIFDSEGRAENDAVKFQVKATDSPKVLARRNAIAVRSGRVLFRIALPAETQFEIRSQCNPPH